VTMQDCIRNCLDCYQACLSASIRPDAELALMLQDCAAICALSANVMLRNSPRHVDTCSLCADICDDCAEACARHREDRVLLHCADLCWRCAESCREMSA
jgi:hypothetical protein